MPASARGSKIGWVIAKCAPASIFGFEAPQLFVNIFRDRIHGDADREIRRAAEAFAGPVRALIQAATRTFTRPMESTSYTPLVSG